MKRATLILADHAAVAEGKLYVNGGGWSFTSQQGPYAIAILFEVPWDETSDHHEFMLELVDVDSQPVFSDRPDMSQGPVQLGGHFDLGRPPGHPRGVPIIFPVAFNLNPQGLEPGQRFVWQLTWNGEARDDWRLAFNTQAEPQVPGFGVPS